MEKINIAELLKDCPKGTKLYSPLVGECTLEHIHGELKKILISTSDGTTLTFNNNGTYFQIGNSECLLFSSKDQRDWSKFQRPFKDGDVISNSLGTCIFKGEGESEGTVNYYCGISNDYFRVKDDKCNPNGHYGNIADYKFATEEEKQKLFDAIKANGYKWNPETKTLEKLSKFKVGDKIQHKDGGIHCTLGKYVEAFNGYRTNIGLVISYDDIDNWELAPDKFDINTLKPFDKVLVRFNSLDCWHIQYFEKYDKGEQKYHFICLCECKYEQCIPYEENKHLLNTTNDCDNYYKTWE